LNVLSKEIVDELERCIGLHMADRLIACYLGIDRKTVRRYRLRLEYLDDMEDLKCMETDGEP
jgi:hypothetical protein